MSYALEVDIPEGKLRVEYTFLIDRYCHRVDAITNGCRVPLLTSCEGDDSQAWPPSPPLQQLTYHQVAPGRCVLLGVGMAGRSHWSISLAVNEGGAAYVWDVACRVVETPQWLGCTYRLGCAAEAVDSAWRMVLAESCVELVAARETHQASGTILEREGEWLWIQPQTPWKHVGTSTTFRWKYALRVINLSGTDLAPPLSTEQ